MLMLDRVRQHAAAFDILHFHIDYCTSAISLPGCTNGDDAARSPGPADIKPIFLGFDDMPLVSISSDQRRPVPKRQFCSHDPSWSAADLMQPIFQPRGGYLAFIGRISPEKRPDRAIAIARSLGIPIKIAAKVDASMKLTSGRQSRPC